MHLNYADVISKQKRFALSNVFLSFYQCIISFLGFILDFTMFECCITDFFPAVWCIVILTVMRETVLTLKHLCAITLPAVAYCSVKYIIIQIYIYYNRFSCEKGHVHFHSVFMCAECESVIFPTYHLLRAVRAVRSHTLYSHLWCILAFSYLRLVSQQLNILALAVGLILASAVVARLLLSFSLQEKRWIWSWPFRSLSDVDEPVFSGSVSSYFCFYGYLTL